MKNFNKSLGFFTKYLYGGFSPQSSRTAATTTEREFRDEIHESELPGSEKEVSEKIQLATSREYPSESTNYGAGECSATQSYVMGREMPSRGYTNPELVNDPAKHIQLLVEENRRSREQIERTTKQLRTLQLESATSIKAAQTLSRMNQLKQKSLDQFKIIKMLGQGCFGMVFLTEVDLQHEKLQVALKMVCNHRQISTENLSQAFKNEFDIIQGFKRVHPNIVCLLSEFKAPPTMEMINAVHDSYRQYLIKDSGQPYTTQFFVLEYHPCTLESYLQLNKTLPRAEIIKFAGELFSCFTFLFEERVAHRDVKPNNILVSAEGSLILSDFGESINLDDNHCYNSELGAGNQQYQAPEIHNQRKGKAIINFSKQYSWEVGCLLFTIVYGKFPFEDYPSAYGSPPYLHVPYLAIPNSGVHPAFEHLIGKLLINDQSSRISIHQAQQEFINLGLQ